MILPTQALLVQLLAPSPAERPSMAAVLAHPFFLKNACYAAPPLQAGEKNHFFLSHFQGNAARCYAPPLLHTQSRCQSRMRRFALNIFCGLIPKHPPAQGPRCMALKFAVEAEAPGARVWLDQDQRDKSEQGARSLQRAGWGPTESRAVPRNLPLRG